LTYQSERGREIIENEGNLTLYRDNSQSIYVIDEGKKVFFKIKIPDYGDTYLNNGWWGISNGWDYYAAEKEGNYFKLVLREQTDAVGRITTFDENNLAKLDDALLFQVATMDLNGYLISTEIPTVPPINYSNPVFSTFNQIHADRLKDLIYRYYSPLEYWVINNKVLLEEYIYVHSSRSIDINDRNSKGRLEDWAYKKYVGLYPGEKVPATYGIEGNYPSAENAYLGKKNYTGNFRDYKFYNRGSGKYEIKTDSGFDEITGMTLEFTDKTIDAVDDVKGVFDQITGLNTDSGKMFRLYNAAFARFPDADGLRYWIGKYSSGENDSRTVASSFLVSDEFKERYGENVSNPKYVETLYTNVLGRYYDQSGYNYWLGNLNNGLETRYELLLGFAESTENKALFTEMTGFG